MVVRLELANAVVAIVDNEESLSNAMEVRLVFLNTLSQISVTLLGIVIKVKIDAPSNVLFPIVVNEESLSNVTDDNFILFMNAELLMSVTLLGIVMEVISVLLNALDPILITLLGIVIEVKPD
jgi:hypothetical protein